MHTDGHELAEPLGAVRLADTALPDVILMDLRMPGKTGSPTRVHLAVLAIRDGVALQGQLPC